MIKGWKNNPAWVAHYAKVKADREKSKRSFTDYQLNMAQKQMMNYLKGIHL